MFPGLKRRPIEILNGHMEKSLRDWSGSRRYRNSQSTHAPERITIRLDLGLSDAVYGESFVEYMERMTKQVREAMFVPFEDLEIIDPNISIGMRSRMFSPHISGQHIDLTCIDEPEDDSDESCDEEDNEEF